MSLFTDASLVYVPSGVKEGKTYSIKPTDGSGDLTFSRGSDIEATRVAANGYIQKAQVNLLLQSNSFDTTWTNFNSSETGGQAGYDGSSDAWLISKSGANGNINQTVSINGVSTFSVYAKKGTDNWIQIRMGSATLHEAFFDLENGVVGTESNLISSTIESAGNGYYRCSIIANVSSGSYVRIYVADADNDTTGTSGNIYIQDAQLNYGLVAQTYQETTTAAVVSGITDNMPRLNYDPANPTCPSLLLEKSSTNEIPNSEYLSAWGASNVSVTQNTAISPEGVQNASTIEVTTQTASQGLAQGFVADGTSYYTISGYYKKTATSQRAQLKIRDFLGSGTTYGFVDLDLSTGSVLASIGTYSVTSFNSDWWYIQVTTASVPSAGIRRAVIRLDNQTVGTQITAYGIMVEKGSYPTSYIPTYGSSATRTADACSKTGISSLIGQTAGTLFVEAYVNPTSNFKHIYNAQDATGAQNFLIYLRNNNRVRFNYSGGYFDDALLTEAGWHKYAITWSGSNVAMFTDGVKVASFTNLAKTLTFSVLGVGYLTSSPDVLGGGIKQALSFTSALSDAEAITLTSL